MLEEFYQALLEEIRAPIPLLGLEVEDIVETSLVVLAEGPGHCFEVALFASIVQRVAISTFRDGVGPGSLSDSKHV